MLTNKLTTLMGATVNGISSKPTPKIRNTNIILEEGKKYTTLKWTLMESVLEAMREHFGSIIVSWTFSSHTGFTLTWNNYFSFEIYNMLNILIGQNEERYKCTLLSAQMLQNTWLKEGLAPGKTKNIDIPRITQNMTWPPLPHQKEFFLHYRDVATKFGFNGSLIAFSMGGGKALDLDEPMFTRTGWKRAGDIETTDNILGRDGHFHDVTKSYPQGVTKREKVTFLDGTVMKVNPEHLWEVDIYDIDKKDFLLESKVLSTIDIKNTKDRVFEVPIMEPMVGMYDQPLPIEPVQLAGLLQQAYQTDIGVSYIEIFSKLGLDVNAGYLVIPSFYLYHTIETRMILFEAFTKGVTKEGDTDLPVSLRFYSESLAASFVELSQGLGIPCFYEEVMINSTVEHHNTSSIADGIVDEEKLDKGALPLITTISETTFYVITFVPKGKRIVDIESIEDAETVCFTVDAPDSLFVCRNYTLTHNTYTALGLGEGLKADRVIVVCPKVAIADPWIANSTTLFNTPRKIWSSLEKGAPPKDAYVVIMNYEGVKKYKRILNSHKKENVLIILDESHNLNTMEANRTKEFLELVEDMDGHTVFLSGTPIKAVQSEVLTLMSAIDPRFKDEVAERFAKLYSRGTYVSLNLLSYRLTASSHIVEKKDIGLGPHEAKNVYVTVPNAHRYTLDYIKGKMEKYATKRLKVLTRQRPKLKVKYFNLVKKAKVTRVNGYKLYTSSLQTLISSESYFHLKAEMKAVNAFEKDHIIPRLKRKGLHKTFKDIRSIVKYPKLKILGEALGRILGGYRIEAATAVAKALDHEAIISKAKKKTLYFTNSVQVVETVLKEVKKNYKPVPVYGEHTKDMKTLVNKINKDPDANPIVATFMSLSTAVPLPIVSTVVVIDSPFRAYILNQAIARAHRLGQDTKVTTIYCRLDTGEDLNILERSLDLAKWSSKSSSEILGIEDPIDFGNDFGVDREEIEKEAKGFKFTLEELELETPSGSIF